MDWPLIHDFQGIEWTHFMIDLDSMPNVNRDPDQKIFLRAMEG